MEREVSSVFYSIWNHADDERIHLALISHNECRLFLFFISLPILDNDFALEFTEYGWLLWNCIRLSRHLAENISLKHVSAVCRHHSKYSSVNGFCVVDARKKSATQWLCSSWQYMCRVTSTRVKYCCTHAIYHIITISKSDSNAEPLIFSTQSVSSMTATKFLRALLPKRKKNT